MGDDAKFLKKHIKTGVIDVHPTEKALVVNYELEATILGELGDPMAGDKKECQKIIRLKDLNETTDINALAREVVNRCKLIPLSKLPEVEQLLYYLQNRKEVKAPSSDKRPSSGGSDRLRADFSEIGTEVEERASVNRLDDYIEMLYEDVADKVKGTALVLQLARNPDNLEELMQNETLLGALARVLREDWRKSLELSTNIVYIFFCFSTFSQFHTMISHFKVGALCVQIVEFEQKRGELWLEDLQDKSSSGGKERDRHFRKFQLLLKKQEQLLRVSLYLLLNLAEDVKTEVKMVNRGIVEMLCRCLDRKHNPDLLILTLTFLKKLSLYSENILQMAKNGVVEKLGKILPASNEELTSVACRLLCNLSFDSPMRSKMISIGLLNHVVPLIGKSGCEKTTLSLLYHLSMDDDCKAMFTYTDCIPMCMRLLLQREEYGLELMGLLINLAICKRNAQLIAGEDGGGFRLLVERAFRKRDILFLKLIRNIAEHDGPTKPLIVEFVSDFAEAVKEERLKAEFRLECLGILGCLNLPELDWPKLLQEFKLDAWIRLNLKPDVVEDDFLLEIVVLLGTVASDLGGAELLVNETLVDNLITLLSAKQEDDEIVLQIIFVFYKMMLRPQIRKLLLNDTQVSAYLIDLMHDKNRAIRKMCDATLEVVGEHSEEWSRRIQEERFRWHNAQWLEMVSERSERGDDRELDRSDVFSDMYGMPAEEILDNYDSDRPLSRLEQRFMNGYDSEDDEVQVHPLTGLPLNSP